MRLENQIAKAASRGLHDAAQPLTVLQGLLELAWEQARTTEDYRDALTAALSEIGRVTACFENVRQLLRLQQPASDIGCFSILQLLQEVLRESGSERAELTTSGEVVVYASPERVHQALSLLVSALTSNGLDEIAIVVDPQPQVIEIRLSVSGDSDLLSANLQMPQLIALSTGGELRFGEGSHTVSLLLPRVISDQTNDQKGIFTHV